MAKFFSLEDDNEVVVPEDENIQDSIEENEQIVNDEINASEADATALEVGRRFERVLERKVENGEEVTEEEVYIATEAIKALCKHDPSFKGFGFEQYDGSKLTKKEITKIALEAISNQNEENAKKLKARFENLKNFFGDVSQVMTGSLSNLLKDAQDLLKQVEAASESDFNVSSVSDKRVISAVNRGLNQKPVFDVNKTLKSLNDLNDSMRIAGSVSKYESYGSSEGSQFDLEKLFKDMNSRVIKQDENSATYDLNPDQIAGIQLSVKAPKNSKNGYLMRNLKANFVVKANYKGTGVAPELLNVSLKSFNKKEAIKVLKDIIQHLNDTEEIFKKFYNEANFGITDYLKNVAKSYIMSPLAGYNSFIFRVRLVMVANHIFRTKRKAIRGLLAWVASSMK